MPFWEDKTLDQLSVPEWESLCDGCARCCLIKLQDVDSDAVYYTQLACDLLDANSCRCTRYPDRHRLVADCIDFSAGWRTALAWLPESCAYRRVAEGRGLAPWHPLISGTDTSVHEAGVSVRDRVLPVSSVHVNEHEDHIIRWVEL